MSEKKKLTKRTVKTLTMGTYQDSDTRHLHLVVHPTGRKSWRFIGKIKGRVRFITIGCYPEITPDLARKECRDILSKYAAGRDPQQEKKQTRKVTTWRELFNWYMEVHSRPHKKSWLLDQDLESRYCSIWREWPVTSITPDVVTRWHKSIGMKHGKHQADRVLALVKSVFSEATDAKQITGANPAQHVRKFFTDPRKYGRDRYLQADEIKRLFAALDAHPDQDMADFFRLCIFTGARRSNVQAMRWADMDRADPDKPSWRISADESKNGEPMVIPLLPPAVSILNRRYENRRSDEWVFPARYAGNKCQHLSEPKKPWAAICKAAGIENIRIHDLRRTLGSWQALLGASLQIIGKSLGHKSLQSTEVYARLDMDPVRASMGAAVSAMLQAVNGEVVK